MGSLLGVLGWHGEVSQPRAMTDAQPLGPRQVVALRTGWSDAAGGLQRRTLARSLRTAYERGYRGGTAFTARQRAA